MDEEGDNSKELVTGASHYELSLEQADGLFQLEGLQWQIGDANDLFGSGGRSGDDTTPDSKWWNDTSSNLIIDQITAPGPAR